MAWEPSKLAFFVWTPKLGKILTVDNLIKWNVDWCCICERNGETEDHLLLPLLVAIKLWSFIFVPFGVRWVIHTSVLAVLQCWQSKPSSTKFGIPCGSCRLYGGKEMGGFLRGRAFY